MYNVGLQQRFPKQLGLFCAIMSHLIFVIGHYFVQKVSKHLTSLQILHFIGVQLTCYNWIFLNHQKMSPYSNTAKINKMLLYRGFIGFWAGCFFLVGLTLVPLSDAVVLQMTCPVMTAILAICFLNEKYSNILVLTTVFSLAGTILITKPGFLFGKLADSMGYPFKAFGTFLILIGAFVNAISQILIKKLGAVSNAFSTALYLGLFQIMICPLIQIFQGVKHVNFENVFFIILVGILRCASHVLLNKGFALGDAGDISLMAYLQVPFGYIVDLFIVGTELDIYSFCGSVCVFSCIFLMMYKASKNSGTLVKM